MSRLSDIVALGNEKNSKKYNYSRVYKGDYGIISHALSVVISPAYLPFSFVWQLRSSYPVA